MDTTLLLSTGFMSLSYLALAFVITPANARYLLAGYNTMSEDKRQAFDIDRYLTDFFKPFFKKLTFFPPLSLLALAAFLETKQAIILWSIIQSLPFIWFLRRSYAFQR
jgi:hypothetical protein